MGDSDANNARFKAVPAFGARRGPTVYSTPDPLTSIFAYVDEFNTPDGLRLLGSIAFVAASSAKEIAILQECWFPPGTWSVTLDAKGEIVNQSVQRLFPAGAKAEEVSEVLARAGERDMLHWVSKDQRALAAIANMVRSAINRPVRIVVAYSKDKNGNARSLPMVRPTDADVGVLSDPAIAQVYLQFVEHFGKVPVDIALARDGLTRAELDQVEQGRPPIIEITNLFSQAAAEFNRVKGRARPAVGLTELRLMIETIFFQKGARNDLAVRNVMQISIGKMVVRTNGASRLAEDIGIVRSDVPNGGMLIYDRFGRPVRSAGGGYMDTEFRSVDMAKAERDLGIDGISITVDNTGLYNFLRSIEQQLGEPNREFAVMAVSLFRYWQFIRDFITAEYKAEIATRIMTFSAMAVGFFVAHAIALRLLPHPAAALFLLLLKGAGMLFAVDFTFSNVALLLEAGSHFARLEEIQRFESGDKKAAQLTGLSRFHLLAGSAALLEAMAEIISLGTVIVGGAGVGATVKHGPALVKGLKKTPARVRLVLEEDKAIIVARVEAVLGKTKVETIKNAKPAEQRGSIPKQLEPPKPKPGEPEPAPKPGEPAPKPKPSAAESFEAPRDVVRKPNAYASATDKIEPAPAAPKLTLRERLQRAIGEERLAVLERDAQRVKEANPDLKLTEEEIVALRGYTSDKANVAFGDKDYMLLNRALREDDKALLEMFEAYIELVQSALLKLPVEQPSGGLLRREIRLGREDAAKIFRLGEEFKDPGFFSTTEGRPPKDMNVKITIKGVNKHGRRVSKVSAFGEILEPGAKLNEQEFLFPKDTRFKVTFFKDFGASIVVMLEQL